MRMAYQNCYNLYGDMYVWSNEVSNAVNCFSGRNTSRRLNIICNGHYLGHGSEAPISYNTFTNQSIVGVVPTWTTGTSDKKPHYDQMVYNSTYNIYVYWNRTGTSSGGSN
jgi:hypothetical protein